MAGFFGNVGNESLDEDSSEEEKIDQVLKPYEKNESFTTMVNKKMTAQANKRDRINKVSYDSIVKTPKTPPAPKKSFDDASVKYT